MLARTNMIGTVPENAWPAPLLAHEGVVRGVSVGKCIETGKPARRELAHAHIEGPYEGWICFVTEDGLRDENLALHELAHLITKTGHDNKWRRCLVALGGYVDVGRPVPVEMRGQCYIRRDTSIPTCDTHGLYEDQDEEGKCFAVTAPDSFPFPRGG